MDFARHLKGNSLRAQIVKGATGTVGLKAVNTALMLALGILLARSLGAENYGIYAFVFSVITLLGLPVKAGLPTLIVRETAKNQLQKRWGHLRGLLTVANVFVVSFSLCIAVVAAVVVWSVWGGEDPKSNTLLWALWLLPLITFGNIRGATLRGFRKVIYGQLPEQLVRPLGMVVLVGGALLMGVQMTPVAAMKYNVIVAAVAFAVGAVLLLRVMPREVSQTKSEYEVKLWAASLLPLSLIAGLHIVNKEFGIVLLGIMAPPEEVALYKIAMTVAAFASIAIMTINPVLEPHVVRLFHDNQLNRLQRMLSVIACCGTAISTAFVVFLYLFGEYLLNFAFGEEFSYAINALLILCLGKLFSEMMGPVGMALRLLGHERVMLKGVITGFILNLALGALLIPQYGPIGAAIAMSSSIVVWNLINSVNLYRLTKMNVSIFLFLYRCKNL
jgi:O-antigen/teichoic acid export membrane protein